MFYCNSYEDMNNQTEDEQNQQQQLEDHHCHDQQQLTSNTPQMTTESVLTQDGVLIKLDISLHDQDHEHEAEGCCAESDQTPEDEGNISANQQQGQHHCPSSHPEYSPDDKTQHQHQQQSHEQDDQQLSESKTSKPQMEKELIAPMEQVITVEGRIRCDERSGGNGEKGQQNPEQDISLHASCHQGNRVKGTHARGGKPGAVGYGKNEQPVRKDKQKPASCDATYSDEEDDKTVQHPEFEFFWLKKSPFSQWYPRKFAVGNQKFGTAEQFMMYQKAVIFRDYDTAEKILREQNPRKQQKLGRQARNFNPEKWREFCLKIVKTANLNKFSQHEDLKNHLFSTYPKILVEASPYDRIWGIGRAASDPKAQTKETWLGHNLLGYVLTDVRNKMMIEEGIIPVDAPTFLAESALIDIISVD